MSKPRNPADEKPVELEPLPEELVEARAALKGAEAEFYAKRAELDGCDPAIGQETRASWIRDRPSMAQSLYSRRHNLGQAESLSDTDHPDILTPSQILSSSCRGGPTNGRQHPEPVSIVASGLP